MCDNDTKNNGNRGRSNTDGFTTSELTTSSRRRWAVTRRWAGRCKKLVLGAVVTSLVVAGSPAFAAPVAEGGPVDQTPAPTSVTPPAQPVLPEIAPGDWDVEEFEAYPDDGIDDTAAIQAALDYVAAAGGGTLHFGPGTYEVSIDPATNELPRGPIAIELRPGVRMVGAESAETRIRLADQQGNYWAVFASDVGVQTDDVVIEGLTIDSNKDNNPIESVDDLIGDRVTPRFAVRMFGGERILIDKVRFVNQMSRNVISLNANDLNAPDGAFISDATVSNSVFDNIGGGDFDFDHSSIYTRGDRMAVVGNLFRSTHGAGTNGVHTAIELHNSDQTITGNRIEGFAKGINVAGTPVPSERVLIAENTITAVGTGMLLWSAVAGEEQTSIAGLRDLEISENRIQVDVDGWQNSEVGVIPAGILTHNYRTPSPMEDVLIDSNQISFTNYSDTIANENFMPDGISGGVVLTWTELRQPDPARFYNITITNNQIRDSITAGIWSNARLTGALIEDNLIIRPGTNGQHSKDQSRTGYPVYTDDFRSGVYIDGNAGVTGSSEVLIRGNRTIARPNRGGPAGYGVVAVSDCESNCFTRDNSLSPANGDLAKTDPSWNVTPSTLSDVGPNRVSTDAPMAPASPNIPATSVDVGTFGATPDDGLDDTAAIQAAIDSVSGNGGGSVMFADGVYQVSIDSADSVAVILRPQVRLAAVNPRQATIRLADAQGNYFAVFSNMTSPNGGAVSQGPVDDLMIDGLVIDGNSSANPVSAETDFDNRRPRVAVRIVSGFRIAIVNCHFVNQLGRQVVAPSGSQLGDVSILDNDFTNIGGNSFDFDHSSIYVNAARAAVARNSFASADGAGTNSVHTAIETHSADIEVVDNLVDGYGKAVNVVSRGGRQANRVQVHDNVFTNIGAGILLWSLYESTSGAASLVNLDISGNEISLNVDDWVAAEPGVILAGIVTHGYQTPQEITDLRIADNEIEFINYDATAQDLTMRRDSYAGGIVLWWDAVRQASPTTISNAEIVGNTITAPLSAGVWSNAKLIDVQFNGNSVINPGRNGDLNKDYGSSGHHPYTDLFRAGVYVESDVLNTVEDVVIGTTTVTDTQSPVLAEYGVVTVGACGGTCPISGTGVSPASLVAVNADPSGWTVSA